MTVVSKESCISISFCYFYSFSSVNFRCREEKYFNRYGRIQTEFQSTVHCSKNKKRVVLENLRVACWECWLCYWVSWNLLSRVYRLILLEAWILNWLLAAPSTVFVIQLSFHGPEVRITFLMLLYACQESGFHTSTAWEMPPPSLCSVYTASKVLASLRTGHAVIF